MLSAKHTTNSSGDPDPANEFYDKWLGVTTTSQQNRPHAPIRTDGNAGQFIEIQYDDNGNMKSLHVVNPSSGRDVVYDYQWDHYNRLTKVTKQDGQSTTVGEFAYDFKGVLVVKSIQPSTLPRQDTLYVMSGLEVRNQSYERYIFFDGRRITRIGVARPSEGSVAQIKRFVYCEWRFQAPPQCRFEAPPGCS